MKLIQAARVSAAFLVVALTVAVTVSLLAGGGISKSYGGSNTDPRSVMVQLALLSSSPGAASSDGFEKLREALQPGPDGARVIGHDEYRSLMSNAQASASPSGIWLLPALVAQHREDAKLEVTLPEGSLDVEISPAVLDKDVIRTGITLNLQSADESASLGWSSAITLHNSAVIAVDLASVDPETGEPISMLLVVRASIVTKKP